MKLDDMRKLADFERPTTAAQQQALYEHLRQLGIDPNNLYQELEMSSRFVDTHQDTSYSNAMVQLHSHVFYEILCCRNTCGAEYLVGTDRYRLQKGDIILIAPGVSHRPLLPEHMTEPYRRDVLWISTEFMDHLKQIFQLRTDMTGSNALLRTAGTRWEFLCDLFHSGVREAQEQALGWESAVVGNTITILTQLLRACTDREARPLKAEKPELIDQVMACVEADLARKITLSDVARQFFVSDSTISHLFKQKLGVSFYRYVTQRRLIAAKSMIMEGKPLEAVAEQVGFSDYSVFYRAFRQEYGISPRQYRNLQESGSKNIL